MTAWSTDIVLKRSWRGALDVFGFSDVTFSGMRFRMAKGYIELACMVNA
jgi:hypothetical protein